MLIEHDKRRLLRLIISGVVFLAVAVMIIRNSMLIGILDSVIQAFITGSHPGQAGMMRSLMKVVSFFASPKMDILWVIVIAFFFWGFKGKIPALWALFTIFGGDALGFVVKHIVRRDRPAQHMTSDKGYSFPSGHVLGFFLVAAIIFLIVLPLIRSTAVRVVCQLILVLAVILVAVSRVYLLAHFPLDTFGAMLLAYVWLQVAEYFYVFLAPRLTGWRFTRNSWY